MTDTLPHRLLTSTPPPSEQQLASEQLHGFMRVPTELGPAFFKQQADRILTQDTLRGIALGVIPVDVAYADDLYSSRAGPYATLDRYFGTGEHLLNVDGTEIAAEGLSSLEILNARARKVNPYALPTVIVPPADEVGLIDKPHFLSLSRTMNPIVNPAFSKFEHDMCHDQNNDHGLELVLFGRGYKQLRDQIVSRGFQSFVNTDTSQDQNLDPIHEAAWNLDNMFLPEGHPYLQAPLENHLTFVHPNASSYDIRSKAVSLAEEQLAHQEKLETLDPTDFPPLFS